MTLADLTASLARQYGDRPALLTEDQALSFDQLDQLVSRAAKGLASIGVGVGTRVGILMPNRPEWLVAAFGALQLGAIVVPINTLFRQAELGHVLRQGEISVLITAARFRDHDYLERLVRLCPSLLDTPPDAVMDPRLPLLRRLIVLDSPGPSISFDELLRCGERIDDRWLSAQRSAIGASETAMIFFTSGTTAEPKGAIHTHASILRAAVNIGDCLGLDPEDRTWGYLPFFFTGGLVAVGLASLLRGAAVLLQQAFEPGEALRLMTQHRCTTFFGWPHQAEALLQHPDFNAVRLSLRKGVGANAAWAPRLYAADHSAIGTWGMTETGPMATASRWSDPPAQRAGSHGVPQPGVELAIVDPESRGVAAPGQTGEIVVRGETMMSRYAGANRADCFDSDGFFHSGDLGWLDADGALHFVGRLKDVIKTAGVNVAAAEIETVVGAHPKVKIVHAIGVPHPSRGENVAIVVVRREPDCSASELIDYCREHLASYKVPRQVHFCSENELPLLGSGKIDKQALRSRFSMGPM